MLVNFKNPILFFSFFLGSVVVKSQTTYYIDKVAGNDANNGTSISTPWQNLTKVNILTLTAGSKILLKAGSVWNGQQLKFSGSGTSVSPIVVSSYGIGADPLINGNGLTGQGVVYLYNQQYIEINNLEITNSPNGTVDSIFFVGVNDGVTNNNPLGADRRGVMIVIDNYGTANHIYLKNLNIHHVKGQLGSGSTTVNGAIPKRTGGVFFTVLGTTETTSKNSRFNDILIDSCNIYYCENNGLAFDNEWNVYYPGSNEYTDWYNRRFSNVKISNNILHHIGKNAMIIRCTDSTGLIEKNVCYETALGTTGNTMFTARAKGTVFQYNEGYYNRATTQTVNPGNIDGSMYDPDYGSVGVIFQYSYSHDNSEGIYWGCNTRSLSNNTSGVPDPGDTACTLRYCISQNDKGDLVFLNYSSAGNEIYNNVFYIKSGLKPNIIHENSGNNHTYNFYNNIIYNLSSASTGADYAFGSSTGIQTRTILNNLFYGNHPTSEPSDVNKLTTDPNFVSAGTATTGISSTNGYKLNYGSPAINSGRLISRNGGFDYFGNVVSSSASPNRGCYQGTGIIAPVINSFTPTTATAGSTVTIRGFYFTGTTSVKFGGTAAASFTVVNDTTISAVLGNGSNGTIIVTTGMGSDTSSNVFSFCVAPTAPTSSGLSICKGSTATLSASGSGSLSWFNASSGGTRLFNGTNYTTPALSVNTTYYVQDSTCAVSSSRTAVTVTIITSTNASTTASSCSSYTWTRNNVTYTSSGTYTYGFTNGSGCTSVDTLKLTIKQPTTSTTTASVETVNLPYLWNGSSYTASGVYTVKLVNFIGCDSNAILNLTVNPYNQNTTLNVKLFLEGYYNTQTGLMRTALFDLGLTLVNDATDTISVNLWKTNHLSNNKPDYTVKAILHSNGTSSCSFPAATYGNSYYIAIKQRNVMETWSALPVTIAATNSYDFTTSVNKAFTDGINLPMKNMGNNKFAFITGDLNNDGGIDISDLQPIQNDATQFYFGYYSTDCTGDGGVDISDLGIVQNNSILFLFYARPF